MNKKYLCKQFYISQLFTIILSRQKNIVDVLHNVSIKEIFQKELVKLFYSKLKWHSIEIVVCISVKETAEELPIFAWNFPQRKEKVGSVCPENYLHILFFLRLTNLNIWTSVMQCNCFLRIRFFLHNTLFWVYTNYAITLIS